MAKVEHPYKNILAAYKKYRRQLPRIVAEIAINEFKDNFRRQGYRDNNGVQKWDKRKHDNSSRATLIGKGSGRMRRDFTNRSTHNLAKVVNKSPYGRVHNEGLPLKGNKLVQDGFTKSGRPKWKRSGERAKMPERPFMRHNKHIENEAEKDYNQSLDEIFKRS